MLNSKTNTLRTMKKVYFSKLAIFLSLAIVVSSCGGLKKMKDLAPQVKYEVTPKVLEMHNGEVNLTISGNFPAKYFNKKAVLIVTPTLKYEGGSLDLTPIKLQGESVQENNTKISYTTGGSFSNNDKFTYKDEMMLSTLEVKVSASIKKKTLEIGTYKVADGIIATPKLVRLEPKEVLLSDKFVRNTPESKEASINYLINRAEIRNTELKKAEVTALNDFLKSSANNPKMTVKGIEMWSTASPDGPVPLNTKLADNRENSAVGYIKDQLKKDKASKSIKDSLFSMLKTPEDWDGFKSLMEKSDVKDKDLVLRVLTMYSDPDVREREIINITQAFEEIKDKILPQLRRSKLTVKVESIGYSDEEILKLADSKPDTLKIEELLYAANLVTDLNKKEALYKKSSEKFATDVRTFNNLGYVQMQLGKLDEAKASLESAKAIENNDAVKTNLGAVALLKGDLAGAEEMFTAAMAAGEAPSYNLGIVNIIKGKYDVAVSYFGNISDYNAALAKLLNKNYEAAITTLTNSKDESAQAYYLRAVLGSRSENSDMVYNNLRTAVGKDVKLKAYAKKDAEFLKYFNEEIFKSIIQ
jgi:tetratricopeptide (TPR) repeat protein